jgi:hypothetical protein
MRAFSSADGNVDGWRRHRCAPAAASDQRMLTCENSIFLCHSQLSISLSRARAALAAAAIIASRSLIIFFLLANETNDAYNEGSFEDVRTNRQ